MAPKISIIVPVYGVEKFLSECLNSILNQTFDDFELILIDDGSKDGCAKIIDDFASKDKRIVPVHKENEGYGATCNHGLDMAKGEYISIIEPDDYISPDMMKNLYEIAVKYNSDIVKSPFYDNLITPKKTRIKKMEFEVDLIPVNRSFTLVECPVFLKCHPSIWSCLYNREFLKTNNIKFLPVKGSGWVDNLFQVQTFTLAKRINYTDSAYYYWRRLDDNAANTLSDPMLPINRANEIFEYLEKNNITNPDILSCLNVRNLNYIDIILDKYPSFKRTNKELQKEILNILNKINVDDFLNSKYVSKKYKKRLIKMKKSLPRYATLRRIGKFFHI